MTQFTPKTTFRFLFNASRTIFFSLLFIVQHGTDRLVAGIVPTKVDITKLVTRHSDWYIHSEAVSTV